MDRVEAISALEWLCWAVEEELPLFDQNAELESNGTEYGQETDWKNPS